MYCSGGLATPLGAALTVHGMRSFLAVVAILAGVQFVVSSSASADSDTLKDPDSPGETANTTAVRVDHYAESSGKAGRARSSSAQEPLTSAIDSRCGSTHRVRIILATTPASIRRRATAQCWPLKGGKRAAGQHVSVGTHILSPVQT